VLLGRGTRYALLASVGVILPIPTPWLVTASLVALFITVRSAHRMNQTAETAPPAPAELVGPKPLSAAEEA